MNKKLDNDYEDDEQPELMKLFAKPKKTITRSVRQHEHYHPIDGYIESFEQFDELVELLLTAPEGDVVRLYISSGGGRLDVADMIVSRIVEAQERGVTVVAELGFTVASAATFISLHCSEIIPSPNTQWTIHPYSSGTQWGFTQTKYNDIIYDKKQSDRFLRDVYSGFMTEDEIASLIEYPRDIHFDAEEVMERWENLQAYRQAEFEKMLAEIQAAQEEANKPPAKKTTKKKST